jgi:hypothetical protein
MLITESIYELLHSTSVLVLLPLEPDPPPAVFHFFDLLPANHPFHARRTKSA